MKITPLFYYPTITIWVDDDQTLLNVITYTFSDNFVIKPFQSPIECLEFIKSHVSPLSENKFLKEINDDETYGALQHSPTDFDITSIVKLLNDDSRKNEITTMVVDNYMSEMNGFELAKLCEFLPAKKILLTGGTNEIDAITGFNKKIIHRFVNKGDAQM